VLRQGGRIHVLFSNRLFVEKAVEIWTRRDNVDHVYTIRAYLYYCGGGLEDVRAKDLSVRWKKGDNPIVGDPLNVVSAIKRQALATRNFCVLELDICAHLMAGKHQSGGQFLTKDMSIFSGVLVILIYCVSCSLLVTAHKYSLRKSLPRKPPPLAQKVLSRQ